MDPNDLASVTSAGAPVSDGTRTCPVTLIGGAGSCQITETAAGHYGLTASYGGSTNFDRSVSPPETVNVTFHP